MRRNYVHPKFGECYSHHRTSMPRMFAELADYNGRRSQGVVHTAEYAERMVGLQALFNEWAEETR